LAIMTTSNSLDSAWAWMVPVVPRQSVTCMSESPRRPLGAKGSDVTQRLNWLGRLRSAGQNRASEGKFSSCMDRHRFGHRYECYAVGSAACWSEGDRCSTWGHRRFHSPKRSARRRRLGVLARRTNSTPKRANRCEGREYRGRD